MSNAVPPVTDAPRPPRPRRAPLMNRPEGGGWTGLEAALFNLVTGACTPGTVVNERPELGRMLFSRRLALTQHLLDEFDRYLEVWERGGVV